MADGRDDETRTAAMDALGQLEPRELEQYADQVALNLKDLEDEYYMVRRSAL